MSKFVTDQVYWQDTKVSPSPSFSPFPSVSPYRSNKVMRKRTSAIEIAFSVLANDAPVPILAKRLEDTSASKGGKEKKNRKDLMEEEEEGRREEKRRRIGKDLMEE
jgi:hypothetical protein